MIIKSILLFKDSLDNPPATITELLLVFIAIILGGAYMIFRDKGDK